jgi:hypothetical protein
MKPIKVIHPITGQTCYTKHPEKLQARIEAQQKAEQNEHFTIYTKKTGSLPYGPQFPRKQWRRVAA